MEIVEISVPLANAIHDYLLSRPMREVEQIVAGLRGSERVTKPVETEDGNTASDRIEDRKAD